MSRKLSAVCLFACTALIVPLAAVAQQSQPSIEPRPPSWYWGPGPWHMWAGNYGWHFWWMGPAMMMFMMLAVAVVIYFVFTRGPWGGGLHHGGPPGSMGERMLGSPTDSALRILNERFARGEIQKEEYGEKKSMILSGALR